MIRMKFSRILLSFALLPTISVLAQDHTTHATPLQGQVVISGVVPDEATKTALISKLQETYGPGMVVDQIGVGGVATPPDWSAYISQLISKDLKSIRKGQLMVEGTTISLRGEVESEAMRQAIAGKFAGMLNAAYTIRNGLRITASGQVVVDRALANRVIEFEAGSALLTEEGIAVLNDMASAMKAIKPKRIEVIGHTDNLGDPARNLALSRARAESVKTYLITKGIASELIGTSGMGADQPSMSNATAEGRRRNRRIEFRIGQ